MDNKIPIIPPPIETPDEDATTPVIPSQIESSTLSPPIESPSTPSAITVPASPPLVDLPPKDMSSSTGDVGYKILKFFRVTKNFSKGGYYQGEFISIKAISTNGKKRRCCYTDGDEEDFHIAEIRKFKKASHRTHLPSRRSIRHKLPSAKPAINITIEEMSEIKATLFCLEA